MEKFVRVISDGKEHYINLSHIVRVSCEKDTQTIFMSDGEELDTDMPVDEILSVFRP